MAWSNGGTLEAVRRTVKRQLTRERHYPHALVILRSVDVPAQCMFCATTDKAAANAARMGFEVEVEYWVVTQSGAVLGPRYEM